MLKCSKILEYLIVPVRLILVWDIFLFHTGPDSRIQNCASRFYAAIAMFNVRKCATYFTLALLVSLYCMLSKPVLQIMCYYIGIY